MSDKSMRLQLRKYDATIKKQRAELHVLRMRDANSEERIERAEELARYYYNLTSEVRDE